MVLGILIATITAPGLLGSQEAIRQSQSKEKREEHRARRCNLIASCVKSSLRSREIDGRPIVLRNGRLWIDTGSEDGSPLGHQYAGYYLPYPDTKYEGLVTTITDVAPIMNWVYISQETHEVRYGVRADAQPNLTGPFDCTRQDRRLAFDGWEGWCAVEEIPGLWALYFDVDDDGLSSKVSPGTRVLEIELSRKEKRFKKEAEARQQDQTTKRAVDASEDAPVDKPLGTESLEQRPGVHDTVPEGEEAEAAEPERIPFRIPKSIFENPPPLLGESIFQRPPTPGTPPPAYTTTLRPITPGKTPDDPLNQSPQVGTTEPQATSPESTMNNAKRTTPKLNRSSGTKALAQAQMFEALAASQSLNSKTQDRSMNRVSRASSNARSVSQYSSDGMEDRITTQRKAATPSPTPPPLRPAVTSAPRKPADKNTKAKRSSIADKLPSRPNSPPRKAFPQFGDPAVFGASPKPQSKSTNNPPPSQPRRAPTTRASPSPRPPPTRESPTPRGTRPSPRPPSSTQGQASAPLRRQATAPIPSPRTPSVARDPSRTSLAATMSSGRGNQGMKNRVGSGSATSRPPMPARAATLKEGAKVGRKTTSALFREIDELVSQEGIGASGKKMDGGDRESRGSKEGRGREVRRGSGMRDR